MSHIGRPASRFPCVHESDTNLKHDWQGELKLNGRTKQISWKETNSKYNLPHIFLISP
eukprot:c40655_g1_i1 orf=2-172(-)